MRTIPALALGRPHANGTRLASAWRLGHRPALDGVRGLAILLVLAGHASPEGASTPATGVTLFFVLSGFLISSLLLQELANYGAIDVFAFYRRRVRRLLPAFAIVSIATLASMVAIGQTAAGLFNGVAASSYVGNWVMAGGHWLGPLSHTWSLAIEEQFYGLWPLVLVLVVPRVAPRHFASSLILLAALVMITRAWSWASGASADRVLFSTDMQSDGLLLGCALAVLVHHWPVRVPTVVPPIALGVLLAVSFIFPPGLFPDVGNALAVIASGALVLALATTDTDRLFENRWLVRLGLVSYGLYLWHYPVMWHLGFFDQRPYPGVLAATIGLTIALMAAAASYRWIERPFRKRKAARPPVQVGSPAPGAKTPRNADPSR